MPNTHRHIHQISISFHFRNQYLLIVCDKTLAWEFHNWFTEILPILILFFSHNFLFEIFFSLRTHSLTWWFPVRHQAIAKNQSEKITTKYSKLKPFRQQLQRKKPWNINLLLDVLRIVWVCWLIKCDSMGCQCIGIPNGESRSILNGMEALPQSRLAFAWKSVDGHYISDALAI